MNKRIGYIFFLTVAVMLAAGCEFEPLQIKQSPSYNADSPLVLVINQPADSASKATTEHLTHILNYTKIPSLIVNATQLQNAWEIPESVKIVCVTFSHVESFTDRQVEQLLKFVSAGNTLFITTPVFEDRFNFFTGIKKEAVDIFAPQAKGFVFNTQLFPDVRGDVLKLEGNFNHGGLAGEVFDVNTEIIAHSNDSLTVPVITKNRVGVGQTIMINSTLAHAKTYRGLLFSLMLPALEGIPYPVANVSTIFLDDFPLPLYDVKKTPIDQEYGITEDQFIANVWWPDMQALADRYHIDYTAVMAFNYNANVLPPFDFSEWLHSDIPIAGQQERGSIGLAHQVKESRHELGFHGYNHFSLWMKDWSNRAFMVSALKAARKRWLIDDLGPLPVTYVPPTNIIDSVGLGALTSAMPQIETVSSLYLGDTGQGGGREFGPDPYESGLYNYPRVSSGFLIDEKLAFDLHSVYLLSGIWTHFLHPDDVFQIGQLGNGRFAPRNEQGLGWRRSRNLNYGLYDVFERFLETMQKAYPMIRYKSVSDAVPMVKLWSNLKVKRERSDSLTYVFKLNQNQSSADWFLYSDAKNIDRVKKHLQNQAEEVHLTSMHKGYLVQFSSRRDTLVLPNFKLSTHLKEATEQIHKQYLSYINKENTDSLQKGGVWRDMRLEDALSNHRENPLSREAQERVIELAVEFDQINFAIDVLERRLMAFQIWDDNDINRLITYCGWSHNQERAYILLENLWVKFGGKAVIELKEKMVEALGVPNESFKMRWLMRTLDLNVTNDSVFENLLAENTTIKNWPQLKKYLKEAIEQYPASGTLYFNLIKYSLYYDEPVYTLVLLNRVPDKAVAQLSPLAEQIVQVQIKTENYRQAREWAERTGNITQRTFLNWLLWENKKEAFVIEADSAMARYPDDDTLRSFIGQQLVYNGFEEEGYAHLYSLFTNNKASATAENLIHNQIEYQSFDQQKQFYNTYPAFFSDSLYKSIEQKNRHRYGIKTGAIYDLASDNFNHTLQRAGSFWEWGNRPKGIHRFTAEQASVSSDVALTDRTNSLWHVNYRYRHSWPKRGTHFAVGAGFYSINSRLQPGGSMNFGYGKDSTYTSMGVGFQPKFTNSALQRAINELSLTLYREDYWFTRNVQSSLSLTARRYTDRVYAGEGIGRLYALLPFSNPKNRLRFVTELSYADASKIFSSGIPYFTPDQLFIKGAGAEYRFGNLFENQPFAMRVELMSKHDSQNGLYITSSGRLNARLYKFWNISLNADISSSAVYRYNRFGVSVSHIFPHKL